MTLFENFDTGLGNYTTLDDAEFYGGLGNPSPGSVKFIAAGAGAAGGAKSGLIENTTDSYVLVDNAPTIYFNVRFVSDFAMDFCHSTFYARAVTSGNINDFTFSGFAPHGQDSGWVQYSLTLTGRTIGQTITSLRFQSLVLGVSPQTCGGSGTITAYLDSISIGTSAPSFDAVPLPLQLVAGQLSGGVNTGNVATIASGVAPTICNLSATQAIVAFVDDITLTGRVQVVNKSSLTLTLGASSYSLGASTVPVALFALSSTKAVALYEPGSAVILDIAGDVITVGTPVALETGAVFISGSRLTATKFFVSYVLTTVARGVVASVATSTITLNTPANASSNNSEETSCATLVDDTTVIMAYHSATDTIRAVALTISGVGFSIADDELIDSNVSGPMGTPMVSKLDATRVVVTWYNNAAEFDCKGAIVTLSGGALTPGTILTYSTGAASRFYPAVGALSDARIAAAYIYSDTLAVKTLSGAVATLTDNNNEVVPAASGNVPSVAVMKAI